MADDLNELVQLQFAAAADLERCAAYAQVLAGHYRNSDSIDPADLAALRSRFQGHGQRALQHIAAMREIEQRLSASVEAMRAQQEAEQATRH
jgi:hypothetical protein